MEITTAQTEKTVFGGSTIAKINSKTVFIPYTMPDELLSINIVQHKKDYDNAEIVKILKPSPHRVTPACPLYGSCGGCSMLHIDSAYQRVLRRSMLEDAFRRNGLEVKDRLEVISGSDFHYRARIQLNNGGFSERSGSLILPVESCPCVTPEINSYLAETPSDRRPGGRVHIFGSEKICTGSKLRVEASAGLNKGGGTRHFSGTVSSPENTVTVRLNGREISFDVRGFFQSNLEVFERVLDLILDSLPGGKNALDFYAGCGAISVFLAQKYSSISLVEHNRDALVFAEQNLQGIPHISYGLSGRNWVKDCAPHCPDFDACVVDPPRAGIEREVIDYIAGSGIPFIRSLSCDPATHARDCARLTAAGYRLERLYLLDFYPNTSHIESLAILNADI